MSCVRGVPYKVLVLASLLLLLICVACNSSTSTKELTESSARDLLRKRLSDEKYMVDLSELTGLMVRTRNNYGSLGENAGQNAIANGLLKQGFILQRTETIDYPSISGDFGARKDKSFQTNSGEHVSRWETSGWTVQNSPSDPMTLSGLVHTLTQDQDGGHMSFEDEAQGTVTPDGRVELIDIKFGWDVHHATYREEGASAYLEFPNDDTYQKLTGKATGRKFQVNWYDYSFSPEFKKQIVAAENGTFAAGGDFTIGDVSDLRLVTETVASARFTWEALLDNLGKTLVRNTVPKGSGMASFAKRPNGTWFVDEIQFQGHTQPRFSGQR